MDPMQTLRPKAGKTYINVLLDRSGSMESCRAATVEAFNAFVDSQRKFEGEVVWTLTIFDTQSVDELFAGLPQDRVPKLTVETFVPRGGTPLFDAIGTTTKKAMAHCDQHHYDRHVLVIQTDGEENSSREMTGGSVSALLKGVEAKGWQIVYLGAGVDAFSTLKDYFGTRTAAAMNYTTSPLSNQMMAGVMGQAVGGYRNTGQTFSHNTTVDDLGNVSDDQSAGPKPHGWLPGGQPSDGDPMQQLKR